MDFHLGLLPSPLDKRDYLLTSLIAPLEASPPDEFLVWQSWVTPIKYQAQLGSCVAFASVGIKEMYDYKELSSPPDLSEQFLYGKCKEIDGIPNESGTYLRAALSVLKNIGVCEETYFPYEGKYPPTGQLKSGGLENAAKYKISTYAAVSTNKEALKNAIYNNGPVVTGINVYENFYNMPSDGIAELPTGKLCGGHAILIIGYNSLGLVVKNSWSTRWGNLGYCLIPWNVWDAINLGEAWTIVDVVNLSKPWKDWLDTDIELGWKVKNSNLFQGYPDGSFRPYNNVTQHQVITVSERLGLETSYMSEEEKSLSWVTNATRGWIHSGWPQYTFTQERWDECLTRYQFAVLIGRYLQG